MYARDSSFQMGCFVVAEFLLISTSRDPSAIAELHFILVGGTAMLSVDQYVVLFCYCSLWDETAMSGGPHTRLCHACGLSSYTLYQFNSGMDGWDGVPVASLLS